MNAKKAKQLRKMARKLASKLCFEKTDYEIKHHPHKIAPTGFILTPQTITLNPNCVRGIYQRMKKAA